MESRQRVLDTFHFKPTDRAPFDLMEGCVWPELLAYFQEKYGFTEADQVIEFLDPDFRWAFLEYVGPPAPEAIPGAREDNKVFSKEVAGGPLARVETLAEIEAYPWPNPSYLAPANYSLPRARWPDKALVFCPGWMPLFWTACELFGMEAAMVKLIEQPELFTRVIQRQHAFCMDILERAAPVARGNCDIAWLGDDFSSQQNMLISPDLWRKFIKPYLAEQVQVLRKNDLLVLFHSCGSVYPVLEDLIEIGVNGLLVFQTTARGMQASSIAKEFGGRLAFYGGIDIQYLLSFGSPVEVAEEVVSNLHAFTGRGGYIVANSHHTVASIRGENIEAMCQASRSTSIGQPELFT